MNLIEIIFGRGQKTEPAKGEPQARTGQPAKRDCRPAPWGHSTEEQLIGEYSSIAAKLMEKINYDPRYSDPQDRIEQHFSEVRRLEMMLSNLADYAFRCSDFFTEERVCEIQVLLRKAAEYLNDTGDERYMIRSDKAKEFREAVADSLRAHEICKPLFDDEGYDPRRARLSLERSMCNVNEAVKFGEMLRRGLEDLHNGKPRN